jgi:hypothetical protein
VRVYEENRSQHLGRYGVSPGTFVDWRERSHSFSSLAVFTSRETLLLFDSGPESVQMASVSPAFFDVVKVYPVIGRSFGAEGSERAGE